MTARSFTDRDVHLALDGELLADEQADFEAWLDAHPEMKAKNDRFADDSARLRQLFAGVLDEPVPLRLTKQVTGGAGGRPIPTWARWRAAAAAAAIFVAGVGVGYFFAGAGRPQAEDRLAEQAIGAYVTYAADQPHAVEVDAGDRYYLDGWLSKRVGLKLVAPDLSAQGFDLLGGRLLPADEKAAALLIYKDREGRQISIYVTATAEHGTKGTYTPEVGGPSAVYWADKGFGCAIVGALPKEQMTEVARSAWRQLLQGAAT